MINYEKVASKIFAIIKGKQHEVVMFTNDGQETSVPDEARRFFVKEPNYMVTLDEENKDIKINKNRNISSETFEPVMSQLKQLAQTYMLNTQIKVFGQEIKPKDYAYQAQKYKDKETMSNVLEASLSKPFGSRKTSYQTLESVKVIVRHRKPVDEEVRGSRSRAIKEIFIERAGERFRFPHNYLMGARAMARHMNEGGEMTDAVGTYIIEKTGNLLKLKEFYHYVTKNKLINETSEDIISIVRENALTIKNELHRLQGLKTYGTVKERIEAQSANVIEENSADDLKDLFTVKMFDESIGEILPLVNRLVSEKKAWRTSIEEASSKPFTVVRTQELQEEDIMEVGDPTQRIGYKLQGLVKRVAEQTDLSRFVGYVAGKLVEGDTLNTFEKKIVKNVLGNVQIVEAKDDEDDDEPSNFKDEWGRDTDEQDEWKKNVTGKKNKKKTDESAEFTGERELLARMHQKAAQVSKEHRCVQHIERDPETGDYRLSDWYDCDNTVASYENGRLKESVIDRMTESFDQKLAALVDLKKLF